MDCMQIQHVKLFPATLFPPFSLLSSLSSLMLSSPINLQEKERYDKLTYESQSILLSPSLKDLSLWHLVSPPELSNGLAIHSFSGRFHLDSFLPLHKIVQQANNMHSSHTYDIYDFEKSTCASKQQQRSLILSIQADNHWGTGTSVREYPLTSSQAVYPEEFHLWLPM